MKMSRKGILFLMAEEAIVLSTYKDSGGVWTIGVGHTAAAGGINPKPGMVLTLQECIDLFKIDLLKFENAVTQSIKAPLKQCEFDALVSFHYNTGAIDHGTVDDRINKGDRPGAMRVLQQYIKDSGKTVDGLVNRRKRERDLFVNGEYGNRRVPLYGTYPGTAMMFDPTGIKWGAEDLPSTPLPPLATTPAQPLPETRNKQSALAAAIIAIITAICGFVYYIVTGGGN